MIQVGLHFYVYISIVLAFFKSRNKIDEYQSYILVVDTVF